METNDKKDRRDDIFSRSVRAGKRTYFFDVKATRADDYYLTITESTKRFNDDGTFYYEKHRLFLYNEDFEKYAECLAEVTKYIIDEKGASPIRGKGGYTGNDAANASQSNNGTPPATDETNTGTEKTEEEVDLVEDAHEKAITEIGSEKNGVDNTDAETSDVQTEETPANVESETETKTE